MCNSFQNILFIFAKKTVNLTPHDMSSIAKSILSLFLLLLALVAQAQKVVISGTVTNAENGELIAQASVSEPRSGITIVTNDDGFFSLKLDEVSEAVVVSHIGYKSRRVKITGKQTDVLTVKLQPTAINLNELVVWTENPRDLVNIAISKIPDNYSKTPQLYNCFYRETAMKRNHYVYVAEGVVDMYKTAYNKNNYRDRVAIIKGRRLLSPKQNDTLTVKVMGGPVQPIQLDIVKNLDFLLNPDELDNYRFSQLPMTFINDRIQYVVKIEPGVEVPYALYYGKLYIDRETLAFSRAELELDMSNKDKATHYMLVRKPNGVRFRPKEMSCLIDYKYEDGLTTISYIRNTFRFNCDWKRRLFSTSFAAFCEMVVTDRNDEDPHPISGRSSFDSKDSFYDKVDYFRDPEFWKDYNIIEPSESLDKAISKLVRKHLQ